MKKFAPYPPNENEQMLADPKHKRSTLAHANKYNPTIPSSHRKVTVAGAWKGGIKRKAAK